MCFGLHKQPLTPKALYTFSLSSGVKENQGELTASFVLTAFQKFNCKTYVAVTLEKFINKITLLVL